MQRGDDFVVLRIVLEAAAGIDHAGDAEAVQLAHELARRVDLLLEGQLRPFGERRVEDERVRPRDQQPVGLPAASRWISPPGGFGVSRS